MLHAPDLWLLTPAEAWPATRGLIDLWWQVQFSCSCAVMLSQVLCTAVGKAQNCLLLVSAAGNLCSSWRAAEGCRGGNAHSSQRVAMLCSTVTAVTRPWAHLVTHPCLD